MRKYLLVLLIAAAVVGLDQGSKAYVRHTFGLYQSLAVIDGVFHITYVRNPGGAFGFLTGAQSRARRPFFLTVSVLAIAVLLGFVRRVEWRQRWLLFALGAILGGALGNLTDRIVSGEVTDFLDFHWHGYYWPAFNVADSGITIGMLILLAYSFLTRDESGSSAG